MLRLRLTAVYCLVLIMALALEISAEEERKVMRRRKVLPSTADDVVANVAVVEGQERRNEEQHYRIRKQMKTPPAIEESESALF